MVPRAVTRSLAAGLLALSGCAARNLPFATVVPRRPVVSAPMTEGNQNDWPMYRDDPERSGFAEGSTVGSAVEVLWRIPAFNSTEYGAAKGSPSVVGDMLYCGTDTGRFIAARVSDGDQIGSSPAVVARWAMVFSAHELVPNGGAVVALDARTGALVWRQPTTAHPHSSVAVDVARSMVFVGDNSGRMYAWGARDGRPLWTRLLAEGDTLSIKTTPTVVAAEALLVFGAWTGRVYALDEATGAVRWAHETGGHIMGSTAYDPGTGLVYVGTPRGWIHALDVHTGAERWSFQIGASVVSSPAVSGDGRAVVVGADNGRVYALRADTGALMWWVPVGGQVSGSPTLVGDRIYVTTRHGDLTALRTRN